MICENDNCNRTATHVAREADSDSLDWPAVCLPHAEQTKADWDAAPEPHTLQIFPL